MGLNSITTLLLNFLNMYSHRQVLKKFPKESIATSTKQPKRMPFVRLSQCPKHRQKMTNFYYQQLLKLSLKSPVSHLLPRAIISCLPLLQQVSQHVGQFGIVDRSDPICWQGKFIFFCSLSQLTHQRPQAAKDPVILLSLSAMMSTLWGPATTLYYL